MASYFLTIRRLRILVETICKVNINQMENENKELREKIRLEKEQIANLNTELENLK